MGQQVSSCKKASFWQWKDIPWALTLVAQLGFVLIFAHDIYSLTQLRTQFDHFQSNSHSAYKLLLEGNGLRTKKFYSDVALIEKNLALIKNSSQGLIAFSSIWQDNLFFKNRNYLETLGHLSNQFKALSANPNYNVNRQTKLLNFIPDSLNDLDASITHLRRQTFFMVRKSCLALAGLTITLFLECCFILCFLLRPRFRKLGEDLDQELNRKEYYKNQLDLIHTDAHIGLWEIKVESKEIYWSPYVYQLFEIEKEKQIDLNFIYKMLFSQSRKELKTALSQSVKDGVGIDIQLHIKTDSSRHKWIRFSGSYDEDRKTISGKISNITLYKSAQDRFHKLFESSNEACMIIFDGKIHNINKKGVDLLKAGSKGQVAGLDISIFTPKQQLDGQTSGEKLKTILKKVQVEGEYKTEWLLKCLDSTEIIVNINLHTIELYGKYAILLTCTDYSEKAEISNQLATAQMAQKLSNRLRMEFFSTIHNYLNKSFEGMAGKFINRDTNRLETEDFENDFQKVKKELIDINQKYLKKSSLLINENYPFNIADHLQTLINDFRTLCQCKGIKFLVEEPHYDNISLWGDIGKIIYCLDRILQISLERQGVATINLIIKAEGMIRGRKKFVFFVKDDSALSSTESQKLISILDYHLLTDDSKLTKAEQLLLESKSLIESMQGELGIKSIPRTGTVSFFSIGLGKYRELQVLGDNQGRISAPTSFAPGNFKRSENYKKSLELLFHEFRGQEVALYHVIDEFIRFCPQVLKDIRLAVLKEDANRLLELSYGLYGVLANFFVDDLLDLAISLQKMAEFGNFSHAYITLEELEKGVQVLLRSLQGHNRESSVA